jgi:hypothetical protein
VSVADHPKRVENPVQVPHFGTVLVQLADVTPRAFELPVVRLPIVVGRRALEATIDHPRDQVRGEGTSRCGVVIAVTFEAGTLQEVIVPTRTTEVITSLPEDPLGRKIVQA